MAGDLLKPHRRHERPVLVTLGALGLGLLSIVLAVEAIRGRPLALGGGQVAGAGEAAVYRACAALFFGGLAGWLFLSGAPRRHDDGGIRLP